MVINTLIIVITIQYQEGNTPYALALKGDNPDTANFVMTEAAKSPKANQQMPQVTIFDLQVSRYILKVEVSYISHTLIQKLSIQGCSTNLKKNYVIPFTL